MNLETLFPSTFLVNEVLFVFRQSSKNKQKLCNGMELLNLTIDAKG